MSNIEIGQVWKNRVDVELVIVAPGHHRLGVLSNDIWIAEANLPGFASHPYFVTKKSLADAGYKLKKKGRLILLRPWPRTGGALTPGRNNP